MAQWKGHFDLQVYQAFARTVGIYPVGALVRLNSGLLAVVMAQSPVSLLKPRRWAPHRYTQASRVARATASNVDAPATVKRTGSAIAHIGATYRRQPMAPDVADRVFCQDVCLRSTPQRPMPA